MYRIRLSVDWRLLSHDEVSMLAALSSFNFETEQIAEHHVPGRPSTNNQQLRLSTASTLIMNLENYALKGHMAPAQKARTKMSQQDQNLSREAKLLYQGLPVSVPALPQHRPPNPP
jgi:hypothetical protein